jgi:tRNA pseudouridine synthase 10
VQSSFLLAVRKQWGYTNINHPDLIIPQKIHLNRLEATGKRVGEILDMEIIEKAQMILEKYPLCDHCLGRQFAFLGQGLDNRERGRTIKLFLTMKGHQLALSKDKKGIILLKVLAENGSFPMAAEILGNLKRRPKQGRKCFLCEGCFETLPLLVEKAATRLQDYEYDTFLVGVKLPSEAEEREDEFKAQFEVQYGENFRNELSRVFGKMFSDKTGKTVDFMNPQMVVLVNPFVDDIRLQVNPLFITGRYQKLVRGIPQSKWFCPKCRGKGCPECNYTGRMHPESVEELIAEPTLERTYGEDTSFHGAGREDADARMLGKGRPFIIQVKRPRKRKVNLKDLAKVINERADGKIKVAGLKYVNKEMIRTLKHLEATQKTYRVSVRFDRDISDDEIEKLEHSLSGIKVLQQTPTRVLRRRADKTREKHIYETEIKRISPNSVEMKIRCQGGLYVKELVTGDEGRTEPNVSKIVNAKAEPLKLDVLNVSVKGG